MDPERTLRDLIDALDTDDRHAALDACGELADWIANGGFLPRANARLYAAAPYMLTALRIAHDFYVAPPTGTTEFIQHRDHVDEEVTRAILGAASA